MKYLLLVVPLLCGFTTFRVGSTQSSRKWATNSATYYVDASGITSMTDDADIAAVYQALAAWSNVPCSTFQFVDGGLRATDPGPNASFIRFVHEAGSWPEPGVIAYTLLPGTGPLTSADIFVNDFDFAWSTRGARQALDLQSVLTHELGHGLGLVHSADPTATMYFAGREGNTFFRTLSPDDIAGLCYLYPANSQPCVSDDDCPLFEGADAVTVCNAGTCVTGDRGYGGDCWSDGDCSGAGAFCVRYNNTPSTDPGICTTACPCAPGDACAMVGGNPRCAPKATSCASGCTGMVNHACAPDVDGNFDCVQICISDANCTEIANDFCFEPAGVSDAGVCRVRGPKTNGQPCSTPSECQSLVCGSDLTGATRCVDPEAVVDPPDPPADSGPDPDGGDPAGGDAGGDGGTQSPGPGGGSNFSPGSAKSTDGGCAAVSPSFALVMAAIVSAFYAVRRSRPVRHPSRP